MPYKAMRAVLSAFRLLDNNLYILSRNNALNNDFHILIKIIGKMFGRLKFLPYFCGMEIAPIYRLPRTEKKNKKKRKNACRLKKML